MNENMSNGIWLLILLIVAWILSLGKKSSKQSIADFYNITRPTLNKWVINFVTDIDYDEWKKKRFLTAFEESQLKAVFGFDTVFTLNKAQIIDRADSDYKTLSAQMEISAEKNRNDENCMEIYQLLSSQYFQADFVST